MNLIKKLRYVPKHFALVLAAVAATATVATTLAWGPSRATFTTANPASYVTFNSITDNPAYGDERDFMRVKPADAPNSAYSNKTKLVAGKEYEVYVYFHNNAAANLNLVAQNTMLQTKLPAVVNGDTQAVSYINSSNAKPTSVWDEATLTSDSAMAVRMVPGSATIYSKGAVDGKKLSDSIITTGTPLGYNALDGKIPGCEQFAGYVKFKFVADQPNFTVQKMVSKHGENKWVENYAAKPGETVDYLLEYKNTGTTQQNNVIIKDTLPANMSYVAGSTVLGNPTNPGGVKASDNVTTNGINVGGYNPGQNAWVIFSAKAPSADKLVCGKNTLINKETVTTANGSKSDTATVELNKTCEEVKKIKVCELETKKIITIDEKDFVASKHSKDLNDCKATTPGKIKVCELETGKIVEINESDFNEETYSKDLNDCAEEEVLGETTPETIASTGPEGIIAGLFGSGALGYGAYSYYQARRGLSAKNFVKR